MLNDFGWVVLLMPFTAHGAAAVAAEKGFAFLKAPVRRITLPDCPAPVSEPLEKAFHPSPMTIVQACLEVLQSEVSSVRGLRDVQERFTGPY